MKYILEVKTTLTTEDPKRLEEFLTPLLSPKTEDVLDRLLRGEQLPTRTIESPMGTIVSTLSLHKFEVQ